MPTEPGIGPPLRANLIFVLPYLLALGLFVVLPLLLGFVLSFQDYDMRAGFNAWVGLGNFLALFHDEAFHAAVRNTLVFAVLTAPAFVLLGLLLALALNNPRRGSRFFQPFFFVFSALSVSVVGLTWRAALLPAPMPGLDPLHNPVLALPALAVMTLWWLVGVPMVLFNAALMRVSREVYEAAALDNAGRLRVFLFITLPSVRRVVPLVLAIELVLQLQMFGQALLVTGGGPGNASRSLAQFIYEAGFRDMQFGRATAASQVLLVLVGVVALVQVWLSRRWRGA